MYNSNEADTLFKRLDLELMENIDSQYFSEPREFRSLNEVLEVLGQKVDAINRTGGDSSNDLLTVLKDRNPAYSKLLNQRKIVEEVIEDVVKFQHGGLNNSVDTMSEVVREYTRGRDDIQGLRKSLAETQGVLTAKKVGQVPLKDLWQKKVELQETLRMVKDLESLQSAPHRVQRLMQQKRYLSAVTTLNRAITVMFGEDLVGVQGLSFLREQLMDLKETLLETCVGELRSAVVASGTDLLMKDYNSESEDEEATADNRSGSGRSHVTSSHLNDEVRTVASQSIAGGALSSAHSVLSSGPGVRGSSDPWPLDLRDLDESLESTLADPSEAGSLYIRLLVKTIGVLECEEDVERMVLDGVVERFRDSCIRHVRENATEKLDHDLQREERAGSLNNANTLTVHTKLFTNFIGSLLDCTLLAMRRMLYLLKLLYVSKAMREGSFTGPISGVHVDVDRYFKEHNKRQVLSAWMGMEEQVVQQLLSHLVEPDVQGITDNGSGHEEGLISKYGSQNRDGFLMLEKGEGEEEDAEVELIFMPSARHAAPIFRRVVAYTNLVSKVLKENSLEEIRFSLQSARAAGTAKETAASNKSITTPGVYAVGHSIMDVTQSFLENELIPVIQSSVNHDMREIQMNSNHFSVMQNSAVVVLSSIDEEYDTEENATAMAKVPVIQKRGAGDAVPLCYAAELCFNGSKPLFSYWLQLHQHRNMVSTVLDRLVRGFASAAREELEALTYNCFTMSGENVHASIVQSMKLDPLYRSYRMKMFGAYKTTVEDLFGSTGASASASASADAAKSMGRRSNNPQSGVGSISRRGGRASHSQNISGADNFGEQEEKGRNALDMTVWEQLDFWDVGSHNYPVTAQKIVKDFPSMATVSSITYACDWLTKRLSGFCTTAARKINTGQHSAGVASITSPHSSANRKQQAISMNIPAGTIGQSAAGARMSVSAIMKANKAEAQEQKQLLVLTVMAGAKELSKIAEEGMALLRGELQLMCFYFLHRLAHIVYAPPSAAQAETGNSNRKSFSGSPMNVKARAEPAQEEGISEEEAILSAFNKHLDSFLQAIVSSTSTDALAALISPLCTVIPRILTHCAMHMVSEIEKASSDDEDDHLSGSDHYLKSHLLRMVVSAQQSFALQIQSFSIHPETKRRLTDLLTDGFERSRRFITMFGMPAAELRGYLRSNVNEYSKEEVEILWVKSSDRDATFAQLWKELESIPRSGPKLSVALQFAH